MTSYSGLLKKKHCFENFKFEVFDEYFLKLHCKWNKNYNVNMLTGKKTCIWFSLARSDFRKENCSHHGKTNY